MVNNAAENHSPTLSVSFAIRDCRSAAEAMQSRQLQPGEVQLWHASPRITDFDPRAAEKLLSPDELTRMGRFHFDKDRSNFLFCRSMLRMVLASYLGIFPEELIFAYSDHGKPSLARQSVHLDFNMSHSNGDLLIATSLGRKIGVDLEWVRHDLDVYEIAQRFFSAAENKALHAMPDRSCYDTFFSCWTRKEAFVKARGEGLSCPLDSFDVSMETGTGVVKLTTRPDPAEANRWIMWSLDAPPGFAAAVAVEVIHG
jgi:4'-phosphopantetheinyl transferase